MEYNIALSGTFDVENYGDLLFPEIFKRAMKKRGLDFNLFLFSPFECDGSTVGSLTGKVYSPEDMEKLHAEHPFDAVVIGGGALIHFDQIPIKRPGDTELSYYHNPDSWVYPSAFAIKHDIKLIYNLPQVPYEIGGAFAELTHYLLRNTDYISVRDKISEKHIADSYNMEKVPEISVYPDSVCCIPELIPESELSEIRSAFDLNEPYAVIHFNVSKPPEDDAHLINIIKKLQSKGLQPVLLPLGYTHRDDVFMNEFNGKIGGVCKTFGKKLTILEMAAVLSGCEMYIGTSFHGAITSMCYGKKALSYNRVHPYKNREIFRQFGVEKYVAENGEQLELLTDELLADNNFKPNSAEVISLVNEHFDKIYTLITQSDDTNKNERENADYLYNISPDVLRKILNDEPLHRELTRLDNDNKYLMQRVEYLGNIGNAVAFENKLKRKDSNIRALNERCAALDRQVSELLTQNRAILSSRYWRLTKPMRAVTGGIKKVMNRFSFTRNILKALKVLLSSGPRALAAKIKGRAGGSGYINIPSTISDERRRAEENTKFNRDIKFSILVPLYNTPIRFLKEMIESVQTQTYKNWELCLADGSDAEHTEVEKCVREYAADDKRILYKKLEKNLGISENTNACIKMATGDYIALFDHDDVLHPSALYCVMKEICEKGADFIYTDEATFESPDITHIITAHYKPDYARENLLANNYICHFSAFDIKILQKSGLFRHEYDGSQDHDMILRLTDNASKIVHIPQILYFWRSHPNSVALDINSKQYAINAGINAVKNSIKNHGYNAEVKSSKAFPTIYEIHYEIKDYKKVSIIIPNKNHKEDLQRCISSIFAFTTYPDYEIIIVDNGSDDDVLDYYEQLRSNPRIKIVTLDIPFNFSKLNNFGAQNATGDYFIMLNNDTEIITPNWIEEMVMYAQREDVGAVGVKLYYPDDTVQHAGIILGLGADRVAGHAFYKVGKNELGYMGRLCYTQDVSAVTAACMLVCRDVWEKVGGLDESFAVAYNDVDFCLRIREAGYLIVWTPFAELYHYESKTRGLEDSEEKLNRFKQEADAFKQKWGKLIEAGDPYYNPNFTLDRSDFSLK